MDVGKVSDHMTRRNCIPPDSVKSGDDYSSLVHNIGTEAYMDSDKTNPTYLVSKSCDMPVGNIRVKRDRDEVWITICIGIIVIIFHITKMSKIKIKIKISKQINKQIKKNLV